MTNDMFSLIRVWAMLTGLVLSGWYFGELQSGIAPTQVITMLIVAIGGFELFLYVQDFAIRRKRRHG